MLLAAAVSCTVAANDFQKISWCGCSVSENWKIPQVRKDPSPLICLKVTLLIFPLTNLQENPVAMKLGCCTYWWQISWFHFVQILCYFFTIFWKAQSVKRVIGFPIVQSHEYLLSSWGNLFMSWDRGIKDVGSLLQSSAQFELLQYGTFSNAKDSGSSVTAKKCMQKQYLFAGKEPNILFDLLDVPNACLCISFWLWCKVELMTGWLLMQWKNKQVSIISH